jgi:hypothetical protein
MDENPYAAPRVVDDKPRHPMTGRPAWFHQPFHPWTLLTAVGTILILAILIALNAAMLR